MNTLNKWHCSGKIGKILLGLLLAALFTAMGTVPASAKNDKHKGKHDKGRYEQRGHGHDRGRHMHDRRVYRSYGYREVYVPPPPVIFVPPPPPGIHIFLPPPPIVFHP